MWYLGDTPIVDRNHGLVVSLFFFTSLSLIIVSLRIYARMRMIRNMGADDYLIIAAMVRLGYLR